MDSMLGESWCDTPSIEYPHRWFSITQQFTPICRLMCGDRSPETGTICTSCIEYFAWRARATGCFHWSVESRTRHACPLGRHRRSPAVSVGG